MLQQMRVPRRAMTHILTDNAGMNTASNGNKYILICICKLNSSVLAKAVRDHTAPSVAKFFFYDVFLKYVFAIRLRSDRRTEFVNEIVKHMLRIWDVTIKHVIPTSYHPNTEGRLMRQHQRICATLAKLCSKKRSSWANFSPQVTNAAPSAMTGIIPFKVVHGVDCLFHFDINFQLVHIILIHSLIT